jgi:hypothetical protein
MWYIDAGTLVNDNDYIAVYIFTLIKSYTLSLCFIFVLFNRFTPKHIHYHFLGVLRMLLVLCILNALRDYPAPQVNNNNVDIGT